MPQLERAQAEAINKLFSKFALEDQRAYYRAMIDRSKASARAVNNIRATFALLAGLVSALAGLIVALNPDLSLGNMLWFVMVLIIIAVVAPIIGGAFGTLGDLYQWERLITIYDGAARNLEVADALSPDTEETDENYVQHLKDYVHGTLQVMRDESGQWGQLIRTPKTIQEQLDQWNDLARRATTPYLSPDGQPTKSAFDGFPSDVYSGVTFTTGAGPATGGDPGVDYVPPVKPVPQPPPDDNPPTPPINDGAAG